MQQLASLALSSAIKGSRFGSVRRRFGADWTGLPVSMDVGSLLAAWSNARRMRLHWPHNQRRLDGDLRR